MVSLRAIGDSLRYSIDWNNAAQEVAVNRDGDVTAVFQIGVNAYTSCHPGDPNEKPQKRALESPPEKRNGVTYVPISFFDQILELVAYHVDENDNIVFTTYIE